MPNSSSSVCAYIYKQTSKVNVHFHKSIEKLFDNDKLKVSEALTSSQAKVRNQTVAVYMHSYYFSA